MVIVFYVFVTLPILKSDVKFETYPNQLRFCNNTRSKVQGLKTRRVQL